METKQQGNFGDWAFLVGALTLVGGYLGYENIATINAWLATVQLATPTTDAGAGAWLVSNWGLAVLMVATIIVGVKWAWTQRQGAVGSEDGPVVTYKRFRFVSVKLVR